AACITGATTAPRRHPKGSPAVLKSLEDFHPYQHNATTELYEHDGIIAIIPTGGGKTSAGLTAFNDLKNDGFVQQGVVLSTKKVALSVWPREPAEWSHLA